MVPVMAGVTVTLKNLPPGLHRSLKESARRNKRSLNQEAIRLLESGVMAKDAAQPSLLDPPPIRSIGRILVSEAELNARDAELFDRES